MPSNLSKQVVTRAYAGRGRHVSLLSGTDLPPSDVLQIIRKRADCIREQQKDRFARIDKLVGKIDKLVSNTENIKVSVNNNAAQKVRAVFSPG